MKLSEKQIVELLATLSITKDNYEREKEWVADAAKDLGCTQTELLKLLPEQAAKLKRLKCKVTFYTAVLRRFA